MGTVETPCRYPLTSAQHYVWIDLELTDKHAIYILGGYLRIDGMVDAPALKAATEQAIEEFASFRLDFAEQEGTPFQTLRDRVAFPFPELDFTHFADGDARCRQWIAAQAERPFDRLSPPLFEFALLRASATRTYWYMKYSHLVFDGWSIRPFVSRVADLYAARLEGRAVAPAPRSFLDFVAHEQAYLDSSRYRRDAEFWAAAFPDRPDPLFAGRSDGTGSRRSSARLTRTEFTAIAALASDLDVSLHDLLLAVLGLCLGLAHGRNALMVGVTMHNRPRAQFRQTTGMFTSVVPARIMLPPAMRFVDTARALKATLRRLYQHQQFPTADIFRAVNGSCDTTAPYDVTFSYEAFGVPIRLGGHATELVVLTKGFNRHALHVAVQNHQDDGDVLIHFDHETALASSIDALCDGYVALIAQIRRNAQRPLRDYRLLPPAGEVRIANFASGSIVPEFAEAAFLDVFSRRVAEDPGAVAAKGCGDTLSYQALDARGNAIARHLVAAGVGIGAVVGVAFDRGPALVAAFMGVLKAGCAYLPLDGALPSARLAQMCAVARPAAILAQSAEHRPPIDCDAFVLECDRLGSVPDTPPPCGPISPHALAYVIFTSGTTGTPAGVMVSHRGLANLALGQAELFGLTPHSRVYPFASIGFDASVSEIVMALAAGGTLNFGATPDRLIGDELHRYLASAGITHITLPPSLLRVTPKDAFPADLTLIVAGEACPPEIVAGRTGLRIFNAYGPTEATVCASVFSLDPAEPRFPIGRPMPNMTVHILDAELRPVPIGIVGEIYIGGIALAWGYADDPARTAARFVPDPFASGGRLYRTGDHGTWLADGTIDFRGRSDAQVKIHGHRIELAEVEAAIARHADVQAAVVRPYPRPDGGTGLAAYVVPRASQRSAARQVEHWRALYDDLFDAPAERVTDMDLTGWTSSYTDAPIAVSEMREWIDETVTDVLALAPRAVLEIGCGAGLLLSRIAPHCDRFVGTDLSAAVLERARALVTNDAALRGVTLVERPADDFAGVAPASFDAVVLNSVCQYFPSLDYLRTVIVGAVAALRDGGTLYIGDVRSAPLRAAFCSSVEAVRADDDATAADIARRAEERARGLHELLVDPLWFEALRTSEPRIRRVAVRLKHGRFENELTRFRYQVVVTVGDPVEAPHQAIIWINAASLNTEEVAAALHAHPDGALGLSGLPNAALGTEARLTKWLEAEPGAKLGAWRKASPPASGMTPAALAALARASGRILEMRYSRAAGPFAIDAVLFTGASDPGWLDMPTEPMSAPIAPPPLLYDLQAELLPALQAHLQASLPSYMVPSAYAVLDALPMTLNGKLDDAALPRPLPITRRSGPAETPDATQAEVALIEIWSDVLGIAVGLHDSFAELGGDSIQSIQIASRARARGYGITVRQVFELQTVARLAAAAQPTTTQGARGDDGTAFSLTPLQRWLFARELPTPTVFNQFITLPLPDGVDAAALGAALARIAARHDSLRLRFAHIDGAWHQRVAPVGEPLPFFICDLAACDPADSDRAITSDSAARHAALDLANGALWSATLYRTGADQPDQLLWLAHHLVVDGVSWRILLDELDTLYQHGPAAALPDSTSFARWARAVQLHVAEASNQLRLKSYLAQLERLAAPAPLACATACEMPLVTLFDPSVSQTLLHASVARCGGQARDVLASALALALLGDASAGEAALLIEAHGREENVVGADLTATTGWFTTLFPVVLPVTREAAPADQITAVRTAIEAATEVGFDYTIARHLDDGSPLAARARAIHEPDVTFGYLGSVARPRAGGLFERLEEASFGLATGEIRPALCGLDVQALHLGGRLQVRWTFARGRYTRAQVERLAAAFERHLAHLLAGQPLTDAVPDERERSAVCPATPTQQGILLHALLDAESGLYFEQLLFDLAGPIDVAVLRKALATLVDRHEALRTQFHVDAGKTIVQEIRESIAVPLEVLDWNHVAAGDQERKFAALLGEDRARGFDYAAAPLVRVTLVTLGPGRARLVWSHSHALVDGWSMAILVKELLMLYHGEALAQRPAAQFRDYCAWLEQAEDAAAARAAWRARLAGFETATPLRLAPPIVPSKGAGETSLMLDAGLSARIGALAKAERVTQSTVFNAAWALLLARSAGTRDVVFGTIDSGRSAPIDGIEAIVGLLIRTVPLRVMIDDAISVGDFLRNVHQWHLERDAVPPLGLAEIQAQTDVPVGEPLFESLVVVENYPVDQAMLDATTLGVSVRHVALRTNYPLTLAVVPGDRTELRLSYTRDRFAPAAAAAALRWCAGLLEHMVATPDRALYRLHLSDRDASPPSRAVALPPLHRSLVDLFEEQVARHPTAPAVTDRDGTLSYAELDALANRLAHGLRARGVGREVPVGIHLPRSATMIVALFAVLKAGGGYVPLDRRYPAERLRTIATNAGLAGVIAHRGDTDALPVELAVFDPDEVSNDDGSDRAMFHHPEQLAYILHTSGSTGAPKSVAIPMAGPAALVDWASRHYAPVELAQVLFSTSLSFDLSVFEIFVPLCLGGSVVVAEDILDLPTLRTVTLVNTVPSAIAELLRSAALPDSVLTVNVAGEPVPRALVDALYRSASVGAVYNLYGPTETTTYSTCAALHAGSALPPSIGNALAREAAYVLDHNLHPMPTGATGDLFIGGRGLARSYADDPRATASAFIPDPFAATPGVRMYRTGDLARVREDGEIDFLGRADDQVKVRGFRIELGEIEAALKACRDIAEAVVTVKRDETRGALLVAHVVPRPGTRETGVDRWRCALSARLPTHMIPQHFQILDHLPRTPSGKIARRQLGEAYSVRADHERAAPALAGATEEKLAAIFRDLLKISVVAPTDSFFDLGGHSLLMLRLSHAIRSQFGCELPLRGLFEEPSVRGLAALIEAESPMSAAPTTTPATGPIVLRRDGDGPSLYLLCPASGSAMGYLGLADAVRSFGTIWGLQAPGLARGERRIASVAAMARHFCDQVVERHAGRPAGERIFLGGWSFGGLVALEVARHLNTLGHVPVVFVFDSETTRSARGHSGWARARAELRGLSFSDGWSYQTLRQFALWAGLSLPPHAAALFRRRLPEMFGYFAEIAANSWRSARIFWVNWRAARRFRLPTLYADVHLLRTKCDTAEALWDDPIYTLLRSRVRGNVEAQRVPGTHLTMFDRKYIGQLAKSVDAVAETHFAAAASNERAHPIQDPIAEEVASEHAL